MAFFPKMFNPNPGQPQYADYEEEAADLARKRALADAMLNRGVFGEDRDQGKMVGNRWIRPSMAEGIQRGFSAYAGQQLGKQASQGIGDLRKRQQSAIEEWMKPLVEGKTEVKPFQAPGIDEADAAQASQGLSTQRQRPLTRPELLGHYMKGTTLGGPAAAVSMKGLEGILQQQNRVPKWELVERYNEQTGRPEKVWVDANLGPTGPSQQFGGTKQPEATDANRKMRELINMGMPHDIAEGIAYGYLVLGTNADGSTTLVNKKGAFPQATPPGAGAAPPTGAPAAPLQPSSAPQAGGPVPVPQPGAGAPVSPYRPQPSAPGITVLTPGSKPAERLSNDTEKLGKELETKMVPATLEGIKEVNRLIDKAGLKRSARGNLEGDVPGFGTAAGLVPTPLLSQEGKDLRSAVRAVTNKLLQAQSGLAVTDQENKRFVQQLQQGKFMSDQDILTGWERVLSEVEGRLKGFVGGYHPDVIAEYSRRNPKNSFSVPRPAIYGGAPAETQAAPKGKPDEAFFPK